MASTGRTEPADTLIGGAESRANSVESSRKAPTSSAVMVAWIVVGSALLGLVMGAIWQLVAARPSLSVVDGGVGYLSLSDSGVGMDVAFLILAMLCGVLSAIVALRRFRNRGVVAMLALAVGGAVGSVLAWRFGITLAGGGQAYGPELADGRSLGDVFTGPLELRAYGLLGVWSVFSVLTATLVFSRRTTKARNLVADLADAELATGSE